MLDKELEAMVKCHEYLNELDNNSKMRVFKYLLDRYNLLNSQIKTFAEDNYIENGQLESIDTTETVVVDEPKPTNKKIKTSTAKKNKSTSSQSFSLITSLNLVSKGSKSLKDYFAEFETKSNFDYNIIILSYLKNIIKEENIGINHIYTCYKHLGLKIPNIKQSLIDTKNRKGWIETNNTNDLQITVAGENYIDHEIKRK